MYPNFTLTTGIYEVFTFPSGEIQVSLTNSPSTQAVTINGSVTSSNHIIELLQLVETLRYNSISDVSLVMPYCAFSRQDRRMNFNESFSLKVFTDLINSCNFTEVHTLDNHSDVATALINNCHNQSMHSITCAYLSSSKYNYLVSPDAGANKKVFACSNLHRIPMIRADKHRDTSTGEITHTEVFATAEQLDNQTVLIMDDICAGGRTFVELAKALKAIQPTVTIHLYVTHGFFHNKLVDLKQSGITKFITTKSVVNISDPALQVIST